MKYRNTFRICAPHHLAYIFSSWKEYEDNKDASRPNPKLNLTIIIIIDIIIVHVNYFKVLCV